MAKKDFSKELFGLSRKEVEEFVNDMKEDYEGRVKRVKEENEELKRRLATYQALEEDITDKKEAITSALLKAETQAKKIVEEASARAGQEKAQLDVLLESEKEKLIDVKKDVIRVKQSVAVVLERFIRELDTIEKRVSEDYDEDED